MLIDESRDAIEMTITAQAVSVNNFSEAQQETAGKMIMQIVDDKHVFQQKAACSRRKMSS